MQLKYNHAIFLLFLNVFLLGQLLGQTSKWSSVIDFDENFYFARTPDGKWGMCNRNDKIVIATKYDTIFPLNILNFNPNTYSIEAIPTAYVIAKGDDSQTLFNVNGERLLVVSGIMPRLMGEVVLVRKGALWGLAKTSGKMLLPIKCPIIEWYGDVLALQYNKKWLLFDPQQGRLFKEKEYDQVIEVPVKKFAQSKTLLLVQKNNKWGVLSETIETVIPIEYDEINVENAFFICKKGAKIVRFDKK